MSHGAVGTTTRTSPSWHCSTATPIIVLSPGATVTVTALPETRTPRWTGLIAGAEQAGAALRLVDGGDAELGQAVDSRSVGARRCS